MWAHERQGEGIIWPLGGWVPVLSTVLIAHGHMVGTEGGVWVPSEILIEASVCLCQEVQEYPCLLICLLGSPSPYLCQLHVHVCLCRVFSFAHVVLFTARIRECVCVLLTKQIKSWKDELHWSSTCVRLYLLHFDLFHIWTVELGTCSTFYFKFKFFHLWVVWSNVRLFITYKISNRCQGGATQASTGCVTCW